MTMQIIQESTLYGISSTRLYNFTTFPTLDAKTLNHEMLTWPEVAQRLTAPNRYDTKAQCPLFKMAKFDGSRTKKGSLRFNGAMQEISAIECDYDLELFDLEAAAAAFKAAGVACLFYSSASSGEFSLDVLGFRGDRWRLVCPLSKSYPPIARKRLVGIANAIAGGVLADESFSQSQAFYYGRVESAAWKSAIVEGDYLDLLDIEPIYPKGVALGDKSHSHALANPCEKEGIVGAFCRAYNAAEAIAEFLPNVFEPSATRLTHYNWRGHDTFSGVFLSAEPNHVVAVHGTWPWGVNRAVNTFDLVRQFKFDPELTELTESTEFGDALAQPSQARMLEWAKTLPLVAFELDREVAASDTFTRAMFDEISVHVETLAERAEKACRLARFALIPAHTFAKSFADTDWLMRSMLPRAEVVVMFGQPGSGKSFAALDICMSIARGEPWRGLRVAQTPVAYIAAEGAGGFRRRVQAYARHKGVDLEHVPLFVLPDNPNFLDAADVAQVIAQVKAAGTFGLIICDTWAQVTAGGDENSGQDMGRALKHCKSLARATGATILLIHHSGKDASKGARGWSGVRGAADAELEVTRVGEGRLLRVTKMKDGLDDGEWGFGLEVVELFINEFNEPVTSCVVTEIDIPQTVLIEKKLTAVESQALNMLGLMRLASPVGLSVDDVAGAAADKFFESEGGTRHQKRDKKRALAAALLRLSQRLSSDFDVDEGEITFKTEAKDD